MKMDGAALPPKEGVRVLLVDDEESVVRPLRRELLAAEFEVAYASDGEAALQLLREAAAEERRFAALLTDVQMPRLRGDALQRLAREADPDLAVMLITSYDDTDLAVSCMREGAADYVTKPFQIDDVMVRLRAALEKRRLTIQVRDYQEFLEMRVAERTGQLQDQFLGAIASLNCALEAKDTYTNEHSVRVCYMATALAARLRESDTDFQSRVETAARLHDVGKIGVPEAIINKPGSLNAEEFRLIRQHPTIGNDILLPLVRDLGVLEIVRHHHECWNGAGYPDGLTGEEIPLGARILAVADAFDAMTSNRPYRPPMPVQTALDTLSRGAGCQWDPHVVETFVAMVEADTHLGDPSRSPAPSITPAEADPC